MTASNMYGPSRVLVDADYRRIGPHLIQPFDSARIQPASYEVSLGKHILRPRFPATSSLIAGVPRYDVVDLRDAAPWMDRFDIGERFVLPPGGCGLVATQEQVCCPPDMVCSVEGKSTLGRCFLSIHVTAGFVDPGYCGVITLELVNHAPFGFTLYEGMLIGQLRFTWLAMQAERPYGSPGLGSHYQGSVDVRPPAEISD